MSVKADIFHYLWRRYLAAYRRMRLTVRLLRTSKKQSKVLMQLRMRKKRSFHVVFLVSDSCKWKLQSVYDLMAASNEFIPLVVIVPSDVEGMLGATERRNFIASQVRFFNKRGMDVRSGMDDAAESFLPIETFSPDIVFYYTPWDIPKIYDVANISKVALPCYTSYFLPTLLKVDCEYQLLFHRMLYRHYVLNDVFKRLMEETDDSLGHVGKLISVGHPMLDEIRKVNAIVPSEGVVIYAPHWSVVGNGFTNDLRLSTFLENGKQILEFAKAHPEIKWAFKPHPTLRSTLINNNLMSKEDVAVYYDAWAKIGECCYDGDYPSLFAKSRAMITDCSSFLVEYGSTGKPIIHLVGPGFWDREDTPFAPLFRSYYQVEDMSKLMPTLERVIVQCEDPLRPKRMECLKDAGLMDEASSAERIGSDLHRLLNDTEE